MTFSCISFWKVSKEFIKWVMADKYLVPPLKIIIKSLAYLFTFYAAPFRVLSWLTDDSFPWLKYWKTVRWRNGGEDLLCRNDITFSSAAKQQSLWFKTTKEPVDLLIEKRALST